MLIKLRILMRYCTLFAYLYLFSIEYVIIFFWLGSLNIWTKSLTTGQKASFILRYRYPPAIFLLSSWFFVSLSQSIREVRNYNSVWSYRIGSFSDAVHIIDFTITKACSHARLSVPSKTWRGGWWQRSSHAKAACLITYLGAQELSTAYRVFGRRWLNTSLI